MTARSAVRRGQRLAAKIMLETCTIKRKTGSAPDPATDKIVDTFSTIYPPAGEDGRCRVKPLTGAQVAEAGQVAVELRRYTVSVPMTTAAVVKRGDVVTVTASDDPEVVGRPLTVIDIPLGEFATARRLTVEDRA